MPSIKLTDFLIQISMLLTTLHFIKDREPDEILRIFRKNNGVFKCVFQPADIRSTFSFYLDRDMLSEYVLGTLRLIAEDDVDPYHELQISTMIHPRILFHVSELSKEEVSDRAWDMITMSWNPTITKNGLSTTQ